MICTSEFYSTAILEKLVNGCGELPPNRYFLEITNPIGVSYEVFDTALFPGWADGSASETRAYGETWHAAIRSLMLSVPSAIARIENNVLIHPGHPEFGRISYSLHRHVWWDSRLYSSQARP